MRRLTLFLALIVLLVTGACGSDDDSDNAGDSSTGTTEAATPEIHKVEVDAKEYSYSMPKEIEGGLVEFTMKNTGKEIHLGALSKVKDGKTFADASKELQATTPPAEASSEEVGGMSSTSPGGATNVTLALEPGTYFFACFVPAADGTTHAAKGMVLPFEVTETKGEADAPAAAGTVTAKDFSYTTTYKPTAGTQVLEFENQGTQGHEITLLEFAPGKGPGDLAAFFGNPTGEPPATFYGGPVIKPGAKASWTTPALVAGKSYFFMCLIPDPADGVPHAAKGMLLPIAVT